MYLADYHVHTRFSPDGKYSMTELARDAVEKGLDELCFTDHVEPIAWGGTTLRRGYHWSSLSADYAEAQAAVGDRIRLRLGIELGDAPWSFDHTAHLLENAPEFDFVIGSIHLLSEKYGGVDLYLFQPKDERQAQESVADYLGQVRKLAEWGQFSVLGHLTLPLRYLNEMRGFHVTFDGHEAEIEEIFRLLIEKGRGIEVNTNRGKTLLPDEKWLRMYHALGGEIVTLGSDTHDLRYVGHGVWEGQALLRQCGFTRFCTFEKMRPIWHELP